MPFTSLSYMGYTFSGTGDGSAGNPFVGTFTREDPLFSSDQDIDFSRQVSVAPR